MLRQLVASRRLDSGQMRQEAEGTSEGPNGRIQSWKTDPLFWIRYVPTHLGGRPLKEGKSCVISSQTVDEG